jgi:hypothetical protein
MMEVDNVTGTERNVRRSLGLGLLTGLVAFGLAACGGTPTAIPAPTAIPPTTVSATGGSAAPASGAQSAPAPPAAVAGTVAPIAGAEAGGGDAANVSYVAPTGEFHFQYPQGWGQTTQPGESVRYTGRDEFISVTIVTTTQTPLDYARADAGALTAASPGYQGQAPVARKIAGHDSATVAYTWQAGPSPVTGKMVPSSADRYYIPGPGGKLAVFTYSSPTGTYDPAGADDFANAFVWGK